MPVNKQETRKNTNCLDIDMGFLPQRDSRKEENKKKSVCPIVLLHAQPNCEREKIRYIDRLVIHYL